MLRVDSGQSAACAESMSTRGSVSSGFSRRNRHTKIAYTVAKHAFRYLDTNFVRSDQPLFFIVLSLAFGGLIISGTSALLGTGRNISFPAHLLIRTRGDSAQPPRSMGASGILWSRPVATSFSFSGPQEKRWRGEIGLVTSSLWRVSQQFFNWLDERPSTYFRPSRGHRRLQSGRIHSLHRCGSNGRLFKLHFSDMLLLCGVFGLAEPSL